MSNSLLIWGAGGHGKVVLDVARSTGRFERIAFLDDDCARAGLAFCNCDLIGGSEELTRLVDTEVVVAIGENHIRARCFSFVLASRHTPTTLVHCSAVVSSSARIGRGTVVMPGVIINSDTVVGENCIINSGAVIEHDCTIGNNVHISPRVALGGAVSVGPFAHVGIGAVLLPGSIVGEGSIVGAGSVVLREVPAHSTVAGVPARALLGVTRPQI